ELAASGRRRVEEPCGEARRVLEQVADGDGRAVVADPFLEVIGDQIVERHAAFTDQAHGDRGGGDGVRPRGKGEERVERGARGLLPQRAGTVADVDWCGGKNAGVDGASEDSAGRVQNGANAAFPS